MDNNNLEGFKKVFKSNDPEKESAGIDWLGTHSIWASTS